MKDGVWLIVTMDEVEISNFIHHLGRRQFNKLWCVSQIYRIPIRLTSKVTHVDGRSTHPSQVVIRHLLHQNSRSEYCSFADYCQPKSMMKILGRKGLHHPLYSL